MTLSTRILLAEDHQVVREGLHALLQAEPDFEVVGDTADGFEAERLALELQPHIVIMDIGLPRLSGIDATRRITEVDSRIGIIILSMHNDANSVQRALGAGAQGYVLKGAGVHAVKAAVRTVRNGERYLSDAVSEFAIGHTLEAAATLTAREHQILKLVAEGHTGRQIGGLLHISPKTVEKHRATLAEKLGLRTTAALVRYAIKAGFVD